MEKIFIAEYTPEAKEQLISLDDKYREKIVEAIRTFEFIGTAYKNINVLGKDIYEIKPQGVRAYFQYDTTRQRIIIIGFICLKKTQKAPLRFIAQAKKNIKKYLENMETS